MDHKVDPETTVLLKDVLNEVKTLSVSIRRAHVEAEMSRRAIIDSARDLVGYVLMGMIALAIAVVLFLWSYPAMSSSELLVNSAHAAWSPPPSVRARPVRGCTTHPACPGRVSL